MAVEPGTVPVTLLGREAILEADDLPFEYVEVPEWGGTVKVQGLTGQGRDEYLASMAVMERGKVVGQNVSHASGRMIAECVVDEEGNRLFSIVDVGKLSQKSAIAVGRVFEVAARLSGLEEDDIEALGKGSKPTLNGDSTSILPNDSAG